MKKAGILVFITMAAVRSFLVNTKLFQSRKSSFSAFATKKSLLSTRAFRPILVSIEGNIGSGKSTLLQNLRERNTRWTFIDEPVDSWTSVLNENGESLLEVFYKDRKRWSYTFQNCALFTRNQYIESAVDNVRQMQKSSGDGGPHIFLTERCLDTDYHVFTKMLADDGNISKLEMQLYLKLFNELKSKATPLSAIVHVNTPPALCAERINKRLRTGESSISMDYLQALDKYQCNWINSEQVPKFVTDLADIEEVEHFIEGLPTAADKE